MRILAGLLCGVWLAAGCAQQPSPAPFSGNQIQKPIITPDLRPVGLVEMVNNQGRFVVISFVGSRVPLPERRLNVFRNGLKVGEIKVTGPSRENNTVADILTGDLQFHDEVRQD